MLGMLIGAALASGATAYAIGYAFIAQPDSFFRSRMGALVLALLGVTFVFLPPQLMSMGSPYTVPGALAGPAVASAFAWPAGLNLEVYRFGWIALMIVGLLTGMRIWNVRQPGWRPGSFSLDASSASHVATLLPVVDSLDEALEALGRAKLTPKDAERLTPQLRTIGRRFGHRLPEQNSAAFKLVAEHVPPSVAAIVTGHILEGAARTQPTRGERR